MTASPRFDSLDRFRDDYDPFPAVVNLIVCPPVVYAASLWATEEMAVQFAGCPAGGLVSSDHITGTAAAIVLAALIPVVADLLTAIWGLLIAVLGVSTLFAAINDNRALPVRRMAESSALILSLLALAPLAAGGLACL